MTTAVLVLTAITGVLLMLGAWIGVCIDANRRASDREHAALRLSRQVVEELELYGPRTW